MKAFLRVVVAYVATVVSCFLWIVVSAATHDKPSMADGSAGVLMAEIGLAVLTVVGIVAGVVWAAVSQSSTVAKVAWSVVLCVAVCATSAMLGFVGLLMFDR